MNLHHLTPHRTKQPTGNRLSARRSPLQRHHRLVRLGILIVLLAAVLFATHFTIDLTTTASSFWTYTVGSSETAVILAIIGAALIWREPPRNNA